MKLRTTTPASISLRSRIVLIAIAVLLTTASSLQFVHLVSADQFDNQISVLNQQITTYQNQANQLNSQVQTLQQALDALNAQIAAVQTQIQLNQVKYDQLTDQIAQTQQEIADNQKALGDTLADLYIDSQVTPLEMLASSKNISSYLDKQTQQSSIKSQLGATIKKIQTLEDQLNAQKVATQTVLDQQNAQKQQLAAQQAQQQTLVNQTQGQESAYEQLVANAKQSLANAAAAQRAYYASLGGGASSGVSGSFQWQNLTPSNGSGGCSGGYPYCQAQDSVVDPWGLYNRECVSYVAWALANRFDKYVGNFSGYGNAWEWAGVNANGSIALQFPDGKIGSAAEFSGATRVSSPQPGDVVILPESGSFSPIGHAMIVESVGSDGWIHVSQYNFYGTGQYSTMDIKNSGVIFLRFPSQ